MQNTLSDPICFIVELSEVSVGGNRQISDYSKSFLNDHRLVISDPKNPRNTEFQDNSINFSSHLPLPYPKTKKNLTDSKSATQNFFKKNKP